MKMSQIQERTITHMAEAIQATVICNDLYTVETNRAKVAEKTNEKMRVEHGEKVKNLEDRIRVLKKKANEYDELYSSKLSLEILLAAVQKENDALKAEKDELEEAMKDAQILGGLGMEKHFMKEFLKHGGAEWSPKAKIKEISDYMKEKGFKSRDKKEGDEEEKGEGGDKGEGMEEDVTSPAVGGNGGDQADV